MKGERRNVKGGKTRESGWLSYSQGHGEDDNTDVVEEDDGHEGVHVVFQIAG